MKSVLVVSRNSASYQAVAAALGGSCRVEYASTLAACSGRIEQLRPELLFIDVRMMRPQRQHPAAADRRDAPALLPRISPAPALIVLAARGEVAEAAAAVEAGAVNYLVTPLNPEEVRQAATAAGGFQPVEVNRKYQPNRFLDVDSRRMLKTKSAGMLAALEKVRMAAPTQTTVLLTGETGTGKGVVAQLIHDLSLRSQGRFISVHCGAVQESLIESELFGHERGAFTGAIRRKLGQFEMASGGTIFLDEIGTVTVATQIKLLQVLQDQTILPVGAERPIFCNVRVIAASNIDLETMCQRGEFRSDLYYRLNVFPIHIPPLRERPDDILLFIDFFLRHFNTIYRRSIAGVSPEVLEALRRYDWPGNIRELENLIQRAFIIEPSDQLTRRAFPQELFVEQHHQGESGSAVWPTLADARRRAKEESEREYLRSLLNKTRGRINLAADLAGVSRRQIHKLLSRYGIRKEDFKSTGAASEAEPTTRGRDWL